MKLCEFYYKEVKTHLVIRVRLYHTSWSFDLKKLKINYISGFRNINIDNRKNHEILIILSKGIIVDCFKITSLSVIPQMVVSTFLKPVSSTKMILTF